MRVIDYMSRNPVGLAIPPSKYDEDFVVASINSFISNLKVIDNVILKKLADQNLVFCVSTDQKERGLQTDNK